MSALVTPPATEYPTACGGNLTEPRDHPYALYQGRTIYFCVEACKRAFEKDPEAFMAGKIPHPIED